MHVRKATTAARLADAVPAIYMVFDLLRLDGRDLTAEPLDDPPRAADRSRSRRRRGRCPRRTTTARCSSRRPSSRVSRASSASAVPRATAFGERTPHWQKLAHRHRAVVRRRRLAPAGGHLRPARGAARGGADRRRAALPWPGGQRDRAEAEPGADRAGRRPGPRQQPVRRRGAPRSTPSGTHWLEPVLVVDIDTHGLGYSRLRQPSFQGVRTDLTPEDLTR